MRIGIRNLEESEAACAIFGQTCHIWSGKDMRDKNSANAKKGESGSKINTVIIYDTF